MKQNLVVLFLLSAVLLIQSGCGGGPTGSTSATDKNALLESQTCINCHEQKSISPITNQPIITEWKASAHNVKNGAACFDCHGRGFLHEGAIGQTSCSYCHTMSAQAALPIKNPDIANMCANCHDSSKGYSTSRNVDGEVTNTLTEHFSTPTLAAYTSGTYKARFVSQNYVKNCRACHNPHDTSSNIEKLRQWARSGKGDVSAPPWTNYDFGRDPSRSTATPGATNTNSFGSDCVRCHTATGHKNFLANGSIGSPYGGTSKTGGKEVLSCDTCHVDFSYKRRSVPQVTAYYNKSTVSKMRIRIAETYPDLGDSNICLNCHVGRETGKIIKELANPVLTPNKVIAPSGPYNFANASFENSHYLTAGATIFRTSGFEFYSSQYYNNPSFYAHDQIGQNNFNGTGTSGPCVTCHMKPARHTFLPVVKDGKDKFNSRATLLVSPVCSNCHDAQNPMSAVVIEQQKAGFHAALEALRLIIQAKLTAFFTNASPYFFKSTNYVSSNSFKNWGNANTMGAAFNFNLLYHDYGAFAHNRFYSKRLIYDSINWIYDNNLKVISNIGGYPSDVEAAIQESLLLTPQQKTDACTYLFTSRTYTTYIPKDTRNWRPGSSATTPIY